MTEDQVFYAVVAAALLLGVGWNWGRVSARKAAYWDAADLVKAHAVEALWHNERHVHNTLTMVAEHIVECAGKTPLHPMPKRRAPSPSPTAPTCDVPGCGAAAVSFRYGEDK